MKKSKLLEILLLQIPGDPEIFLWNGHDDYQDIDGNPQELPLVKMEFDWYKRQVEHEEKVARSDYTYVIPDAELADLKKQYKSTVDWKIDQYVTPETGVGHKVKKVYMLQPKQRK